MLPVSLVAATNCTSIKQPQKEKHSVLFKAKKWSKYASYLASAGSEQPEELLVGGTKRASE